MTQPLGVSLSYSEVVERPVSELGAALGRWCSPDETITSCHTFRLEVVKVRADGFTVTCDTPEDLEATSVTDALD